MNAPPRGLCAVLTTAGLGLAWLCCAGASYKQVAHEVRPAADVRIGVYDSRAVAIAWAASRFNTVGEKKQDLATAREAGDQTRIAELTAWGEGQQRKLHLQGFGRVPVQDLLEPVREELAHVLQNRNLAAIAMQCDSLAAGTATIDITDDLVRLYDPTARTLEWIGQLKDRDPLPLEELVRLPAGG